MCSLWRWILQFCVGFYLHVSQPRRGHCVLGKLPFITWRTQTVHRDYIWWWIFDVACSWMIQSNRQGLSVSEESIHTNLPCFIGVANYQDKQDSLAGKWFFWDAFPLYVYLSRFCHFFLFVTVYKLLAVFFQTCLYYLDLWWNRVNILTVPYSRD